MDNRTLIAKRVAQEFQDGDVVNLGIGIPTLVANFIPENIQITLHSENGFIGLDSGAGAIDPDLTDAGGRMVTCKPDAAMFDSAMSFAIVRGRHLDATVLGALEVDEAANLANWMVPGKMVPGMGGAMDLVVGARKVIVAMEHAGKDGSAKIVKKCSLPLTACGVVDLIITNLAVFAYEGGGLVLKELAPGIDLATVQQLTAAGYTVSPHLKTMDV